jgi:menaquinone-dependent protoporphyrinogen IX oxidase
MAITIARQRWNASRRTRERADIVAERLRRQGHDVRVVDNDQMQTLAYVEYDSIDEGAAVGEYDFADAA